MRYLSAFGRPSFLLGVNYWSRAGGPRMWDPTRWDEHRVTAEIAEMRALGLNACRAFLFIPTFMSRPPAVDRAALARLRTFVDRAAEAGLAVLPSLLVGHMSGENFDFPGQCGRNLYADPELLDWQRALARAAGAALKGNPGVTAWVISNEMPLWGGPAPPAVVQAWCGELVDALRAAVGPQVPIGSGDGVMNLKGGQNGFDPERLVHQLDYLAPHVYPANADPVRQALYAEYAIRSVQHLGKPVLLEEFGCSAAQAGADEQAIYWRETVSTAMATGAAGALGWCMNDFDLASDTPYDHHAFELGFGLVRHDGSTKPAAHAMRALAEQARSIDFAALDFAMPRVALVRPSYFETTYPFSWEDRGRMFGTLLAAFGLARAAGLQVDVVPETHELTAYDLILAPATQKLLSPTWERLAARAAGGATVYWSYFGGDYDFHQGMWCHNFEELTGCAHRLRYGVPDLPPPRVEISGDGLAIAIEPAGTPFQRAYLPLEPRTGVVVARDQAGRPAVVRNALGRGSVFFCAYPWEHYAAQQTGDRTSQALYAWLALAAGARVDATADPAVQLHRARGHDEELVWVFNRSWEERAADVDAPGGGGPYAAKELRLLRIPR
jgi:endo-1,4-beta-mannosidase